MKKATAILLILFLTLCSICQAESVQPDAAVWTDGEYNIGQDIEPGKYSVSVQEAKYVEHLGLSFVEYTIEERDETEGRWKTLQIEDLFETGATTTLVLQEGQRLTITNGSFSVAEKEGLNLTYSEGSILPSGIYIVGTDIPAGRYSLTVQRAIYNEGYKKSFIEFAVSEKSESSDNWTDLQVEDLYKPGETASLSLFDGQKLIIYNGEFIIDEKAENKAPGHTAGETIYSGEYIAGEDIPAGRYVLSVQKANYSDFVGKNYVEYQIYENIDSEWKRTELKDLYEIEETVSFTLQPGQKLGIYNGEFLIVKQTETDKQSYDAGEILYPGNYLVSSDIPAGQYTVSVQKLPKAGDAGAAYIKYEICDYDSAEDTWTAQLTEYLDESNKTLSFTLQDGQKLIISYGELLINEHN